MLKSKKILITGATSGAGLAMAHYANEQGAEVILMGRNEKKLKQLVKKLDQSKAKFICLDFVDSNMEQISNALGQVTAITGAIDGVFHAAGVGNLKPLKYVVESDFEIQNKVCVYPAVAMLKWAHSNKSFSEGGSIIFMSSVSASRGSQGLAAYSSAKAVIENLVRVSAVELAKRKIRVNAIRAGAFQSRMHDDVLRQSTTAAMANLENKHPLGFGDVEDITKCVDFLISDNSSWITGTAIDVDGGFLA